MEALIGAGATIIGGLLGALFTWLTMRAQATRQEGKDKNKLKLEKLEELHQLLGRYPEALHSAILTHESDILEAGFSQLIPKHLMPERPEFSAEPVPLDRVESLIDLYAESLADDFKSLEKLTQDFTDILLEATQARVRDLLENKLPESGSKPLLQSLEKISELCEQMQKKVAVLAKQLV
jgi:hypothetical protein